MGIPSYDVDLEIAALPETKDPELLYELTKIHSALRALADVASGFTGGGTPLPTAPAGDSLISAKLLAPFDLTKGANLYMTASPLQANLRNANPAAGIPANCVVYNWTGTPSGNIIAPTETINVTRTNLVVPLPPGTWPIGSTVICRPDGVIASSGTASFVLAIVVSATRMAVITTGLAGLS